LLDCSKGLNRSTSVNSKPVSPPSPLQSGKGASVVVGGGGDGGQRSSSLSDASHYRQQE
jgi:hypothetical protein